MKKQNKLNSILAAATLCAVSAVATTALAQQAPADQTPQQQQELQQERQQQPAQTASTAAQPQVVTRCSEMIGMKVENQRGQKLGRISDVVIGLDKDRVSYCVLDVKTGIFTRSKLLAVPMAAFHTSGDGAYLVLNASRENIARATGFNPNEWPSTSNPMWGAQPEGTPQLPPAVVFAPAPTPPAPTPAGYARPSYPWNPDPTFPPPSGGYTASHAADALYFQVQFGPIAMPH